MPVPRRPAPPALRLAAAALALLLGAASWPAAGEEEGAAAGSGPPVEQSAGAPDAPGLPPAPADAPTERPCAADDGGLALPEGFCAVRFAEDTGAVRNLAVAPNGDVFAALRENDAGVLALRDSDGDGRADVRRRFGPPRGHGIVLTDTHLYLAARDRVVRWPWPAGQLEPGGEPETLVRGFPEQQEHAAKGLALGPDGALYVSVGAPSNSCQKRNRTEGSPGLDPCPQLERHAGVWRFDASTPGQRFSPERRFASGMRHTLALTVHPQTGAPWAVVNGRDMLAESWGWSAERNARLPAEEMVRVREGTDLGWPYCFYDGPAAAKVLAPEYGGDGETVGRCADADRPDLAFPAHWAPMDLAFVPPDAPLPADWRGGALVAFRGSWNRAPLPQEGYRVSFVPFAGGRPSGEPRTFAIGEDQPTTFRMTGVALGPDGSVWIAADANEVVWRVEPPREARAKAAPADAP